MVAAWLVHLFTASGVVLAFLALVAVVEQDYRLAFAWLGLQVLVDAVDGVLARRARVTDHLPWFNGAKLDDIVDYLTYVVIPALMVWHALLVPEPWTIPIPAAMLLASAYGFNRDDAKTPDHFFTGFPSYWNIVVFYLFVARWPVAINAAILTAFVALMFVPIRYVYPSRTPIWRPVTVALGCAWGVLVAMMLWQPGGVAPALLRVAPFSDLLLRAVAVPARTRRRRTGALRHSSDR